MPPEQPAMPQPDAEQATTEDAGPVPVTYYRLDDGGAIAREVDEWERQVWRPSIGEWVDADDIDFATEAREIDPQEAEAEVGGFGEFGPDGEQQS